MRYSMGTSVLVLVSSLLITDAWSPSILSPVYWIFSPPYSSILEMYERSRRSPKSFTNSSRSAWVRSAQCRPSERLAVSPKSKMSSATRRTAVRLSLGLSFSAGSSISLSTRSTCVLSWSVGAPALAGGTVSTVTSVRAMAVVSSDLIIRPPGDPASHLAENVFRQQLLEVDGRLHLPNLAARLNDLVRSPRADPHIFFADQPLRLDRRDRVFLESDAFVDTQHHASLVIVEADRLHPPDLHARDLNRRAGLETAHGRKVDRHHIAPAAEERHPAELDGKIPQGHDAEHHE